MVYSIQKGLWGIYATAFRCFGGACWHVYFVAYGITNHYIHEKFIVHHRGHFHRRLVHCRIRLRCRGAYPCPFNRWHPRPYFTYHRQKKAGVIFIFDGYKNPEYA